MGAICAGFPIVFCCRLAFRKQYIAVREAVPKKKSRPIAGANDFSISTMFRPPSLNSEHPPFERCMVRKKDKINLLSLRRLLEVKQSNTSSKKAMKQAMKLQQYFTDYVYVSLSFLGWLFRVSMNKNYN